MTCAAMPMCDEREMAAAISGLRGRIVITAHIRPDGDAVGAACGLRRALANAGRDAVVAGVEPFAAMYDFIDGTDAVIPAKDFTAKPGDTLVVVDCGIAKRLNPDMVKFTELMPVLCIDHHVGGTGFGGPTLVEADAGSVSEVVLRVIQAAGFPIDSAVAEALWTGIITDTGRFSYDATSPATLRAATTLLEAGVRTDMIAESVYGRNELRRLRLQRRLLENLVALENDRIAVSFLSPEDYEAEGCTASDSDNFVDIVRSVDGCLLAAFVRKVNAVGECNISLRVRGPFDAAAICAEAWGGGGHIRAAGATVPGDLADVVRDVTRVLEEKLKSERTAK